MLTTTKSTQKLLIYSNLLSIRAHSIFFSFILITTATMNIKPIKTVTDYKKALHHLNLVFDANPDTPEGDIAEILSILIEQYEDKHFPISEPNPIEAIKFRMEQQGINISTLGDIIGYKSRASEILKGKRNLTLPMIRKLSSSLHIPADTLIKEYVLV